MKNYEEFCDFCHILYNKNLAPGRSGNASINIGSHIVITPTGKSFNDISIQNIVEMDFEGKPLNNKTPSNEKFMHTEIYKKRKDIFAIIHSHSPFLSTFALLGKEISDSNIVELNYLFKGKVPVIKFCPVGSKELALAVSKTLENYDAAILENHGAIVIANNIQNALYKYETLEYMAQVIFQASMLGAKLWKLMQ